MVDKVKRKRKRKSTTKTTQSQSQKVIVNIGTTSARKTKPRTGGGRSSQPQVIYQPAPIPLQPNYSTEINDLRREVRANREQPQGQRTAPLLTARENLMVEEGNQGTVVQAETQDAPPAGQRLGGVAPQSRLVDALDLSKPVLTRSPSSQSSLLKPVLTRSTSSQSLSGFVMESTPSASERFANAYTFGGASSYRAPSYSLRERILWHGGAEQSGLAERTPPLRTQRPAGWFTPTLEPLNEVSQPPAFMMASQHKPIGLSVATESLSSFRTSSDPGKSF